MCNAFALENTTTHACRKCKLVAQLEEKVKELEQLVAMPKALREDEKSIDRTLQRLPPGRHWRSKNSKKRQKRRMLRRD